MLRPVHKRKIQDTSEVDLEESRLSESESEIDDGPRVVQWVDDDQETETEAEEDIEEDGPMAGPSKLANLQDDLSSLPMGALRKAQNALKNPESDDSSGSESDSAPEDYSKHKTPFKIGERKPLAKRSNKHAPTEISSKIPVTRRRTVVENNTLTPRDPRFLSMAGEYSDEHFQKNYGFLADAHKTELSTLRSDLKRARKTLSSISRDMREDKLREISRLEMTIKRTESLVNKDRLDRVYETTLKKVAKDEKEKEMQGKGRWYMKDAERKELLVKARYEAVAQEGGQKAVKKAIEKKQKKIGQKEKRSRPFSKVEGRAQGRSDEHRPKRRRV